MIEYKIDAEKLNNDSNTDQLKQVIDYIKSKIKPEIDIPIKILKTMPSTDLSAFQDLQVYKEFVADKM